MPKINSEEEQPLGGPYRELIRQRMREEGWPHSDVDVDRLLVRVVADVWTRREAEASARLDGETHIVDQP